MSMKKIKVFFSSLQVALLQVLPEEFSILREKYYNSRGFFLSKKCRLSPNVTLRGKVKIGDYSKVDKMTYLFGDYETGIKIGEKVNIAPNCRIQGKVEIGNRSSMSQNGSISGEHVGVFIGEDVMIGPNVVIVAFNHGYSRIDIPMKNQPNEEEVINIGHDVWIGANVTIGKGVSIGQGSIIGSNSFVNKDVPAYSIAGGVPARIIGSRNH
jgi:acetyltransferase-like isoleucine patch superfamily enzyme